MLSWLAARFPNRRNARKIYGVVVAQSRLPAFYEIYGVPDTAEGRFELIVLHLALVLERLEAMGANGRRLAQETGEVFVVDMDDNMREMGVGDLAVPVRVKRAAAGLYERARQYRAATADSAAPTELVGLVGRLLLVPEAGAEMASRLAGYVRQSRVHLARQSDASIASGGFSFAGLPGASR